MAKRPVNADANAARRALVAAMLLVVGSFSASLWYSQFRLAQIDRDALEIQSNTAPSIQHLAEARGDLMQVGIGASEVLFGPVAEREAAERKTEAARAHLREDLTAYAAIPSLPGEGAGAARLHDAFDRLDGVVNELLLSHATLGDDLAARALVFEEMSNARTDLSASIEALLVVNAAAIEARTEEIVQAHARAFRSALLLGLLSIAAATVATVLVLIVMRQQAALIAERRAFLESKATELEAFAGRVAHDLKNPLAALLLLVESGQRKHAASDPELALTFTKLGGRLQAMNRMIDAFLEFARGAARPAHDARAELRQVVDDVVNDVLPLAEQARTTVRVDDFPPVVVACAPGVLRSVLANLIQNAVKYIDRGPNAERRIEVHVADVDAAGDVADAADVDGAGDRRAVRVEIADTGPGIAPEQTSSIFEPFVRVGVAHVQGIGLGLATVKRIIESHGGRVGVSSRVGHGSRFWFELPKAR